jgi:hypothetical protein
MPEIHLDCTCLEVGAESYRLQADLATGRAVLCNASGAELLRFPLDVKLVHDGATYHMPPPLRCTCDGTCVTLRGATPAASCTEQRLILDFRDAYFTAGFEADVAPGASLAPGIVELFRDPEMGMRINHMKHGFCYPDRPDTEAAFFDLFPSVSAYGLASPPMLCMAMEFHHGLVGMGLLDLPRGGRFGVCNPFTTDGDAFTGLRVDAPCGQLRIAGGRTYRAPEVAVTFPSDAWASLSVFRDVLARLRPLPSVDITQRPAWWKRPLYCTYGDQIMELEPALFTDHYWDARGFTQDWVMQKVELARARLGTNAFSVMIDAFWQRPWDPDPRSDPERFPDMRGLIERLHAMGHKVLLWTSPFRHGLKPGVATLARKHGLPTIATPPSDVIEQGGILDFTHPSAEPYLRELCKGFFGDEPGSLNADGLKMDFVAHVARPERGDRVSHPENGLGIGFVERFLTLLHAAATDVKPDVLLNYSTAEPRLQHLVGSNRLHDTRFSHRERERRARASALSCPELLIDSDGALMQTDWVGPTYMAAAVYGTPSCYYVDRLSDGERLAERAMRTLGRLFDMCANRVWGMPEFIAYGSWRSHDATGRLVAESHDGKLCWIMQTEGSIKALAFTDHRGAVTFPGNGVEHVTPEPVGMTLSGNRIEATWQGGVVYTILTR